MSTKKPQQKTPAAKAPAKKPATKPTAKKPPAKPAGLPAVIEQGPEKVTDGMIISYCKTFLPGLLTEHETAQFLSIAKACQLNPFKREIYAVPYKLKDGTRKLSIITGYEVYLKRAEALRVLVGWSVWTEGKGPELKAVIEIHRRDWKKPFRHEVDFIEYDQGRGLWTKMPKMMIKKVAMATGFRLCFPEHFGEMPYIADELPDEMTRAPEVEKPAPTITIDEAVKVLKESKSKEQLFNSAKLLTACQWTDEEKKKLNDVFMATREAFNE